MQKRLVALPKPVIVGGVLLVVWFVWRAFMPLPPAMLIRWTYPRPSPAVASADGTVVTPNTLDETVVDGIFRVPWGVVVAYHTDQSYGYSVLKKGWFWWKDASADGASLPEPQPNASVLYDIGMPRVYVEPSDNDRTGLRWAQLVRGQRIDPNIERVRVRFDDGSTQEALVVGERFTVFASEHGAACELVAIAANAEPLQTLRVELRLTKGGASLEQVARLGFDPAAIDCAGIW